MHRNSKSAPVRHPSPLASYDVFSMLPSACFELASPALTPMLGFQQAATSLSALAASRFPWLLCGSPAESSTGGATVHERSGILTLGPILRWRGLIGGRYKDLGKKLRGPLKCLGKGRKLPKAFKPRPACNWAVPAAARRYYWNTIKCGFVSTDEL
jgi:hypothetical protein